MFLFLASLIAALLLPLVVPVWWVGVAATGALALVLGRTPGRSFGQGFAGVALAWVLWSAAVALGTGSPIGPRMATLLPLGGSTAALIVVQGLVGGLAGGLAAAAGTALRRALRPAEA